MKWEDDEWVLSISLQINHKNPFGAFRNLVPECRDLEACIFVVEQKKY